MEMTVLVVVEIILLGCILLALIKVARIKSDLKDTVKILKTHVEGATSAAESMYNGYNCVIEHIGVYDIILLSVYCKELGNVMNELAKHDEFEKAQVVKQSYDMHMKILMDLVIHQK